MDNKLPTECDLIIIGTGVIESIISAAASRIGKNVLHLDKNNYYGDDWASFNLNVLHEFSPGNDNNENKLGNDKFNIKNFEAKFHVPENCETDEETNSEKVYHSVESLLNDSRKFNIDLIPKIHYARGDFVELLISSNIARYMEYRSVSRILTLINGNLETVPCSRSDVFANNKVSVIEKRILMKLLTSLDKIDLNDGTEANFYEFLKNNKLSENLIEYVMTMARCTHNSTILTGIENLKRFLNSLGRFGKTPFLFSLYGSGETAQAFCRLSAVFGGIYALTQNNLSHLKIENNKVDSIICDDQEIKAQHFILSAKYSPDEYINKSLEITEFISRGILITDKSLMPSEKEHLTLLIYPLNNNKDSKENLITIIEMGALTGTCPKGLYLVHLTGKQIKNNPKEDFGELIASLFNTTVVDEENEKPRILWSSYFSLPNINDINLINETTPDNLFLCNGPDLDLDYDFSIKKAKEIFSKIYPDLDFLPRAPDPEEIVFGAEETINEETNNEDFNKNPEDDNTHNDT